MIIRRLHLQFEKESFNFRVKKSRRQHIFLVNQKSQLEPCLAISLLLAKQYGPKTTNLQYYPCGNVSEGHVTGAQESRHT